MGIRSPIAFALLSAALFAQTPDGTPAFEVASIKPAPEPDWNKPVTFGPRGGPGTTDPGLFACERCKLLDLVERAFDVPWYRIPNRNSIDNDVHFQVGARVPEGTTVERFRWMLQNFLTERFSLAVHRDTREMSTYRLVVMKGGPKFQRSAEGDVTPPDAPKMPAGTMRLPARKWTMERFAKWLEGYAEGPVVDATGLKGEYDFVLWWSFDTLDDPDAGPAMFSALQLQLGLKLESKRGPVEVLVIDHAEKVPRGN